MATQQLSTMVDKQLAHPAKTELQSCCSTTCDRSKPLLYISQLESVQADLRQQMAELVAQVANLAHHIANVATTYDSNTGHEPSLSVFHRALDEAQEAVRLTPTQCLRQIQAEAGRTGWLVGARERGLLLGSHLQMYADQYAERVKAGE